VAISANNMNNVFIKTYLSQVNNNDTATSDSSKVLQEEKFLQQFAFKMVLQQMMDSMGNSSMSDLISTALDGDQSINAQSSLNMLGNYNSSVRSLDNIKYNSYNNYSSSVGLSKLGLLASKYESNLNPGAISNNPGDYGGKSYGAWQFSSKTGSLNSFVNSLKNSNNEFYTRLSEAKIKDGNTYGAKFDEVWTDIANKNKNEFLKIQQDYIRQTYYDQAANNLKSKYGFDISQKSDALKESLWSTVVQHGVGGTDSIFSKLNLKNSDKQIINDLYNERQKVNIYFRSSSEDVKQSVYNRFTREKSDMLNKLNSEIV
jgi:hypothetical protein